jgi:hypothetical protein
MITNYLESVKKQFLYYKQLGEKTFEQLSDEQLFWQSDNDSNSIAIIVNHLWGNMRSRWTDFLTSDGEKEWRERDEEFESEIKSREQLLLKWAEGWQCLFSALEEINETNFDTTIYIRSQAHTIVDAVNRQMMHYASHIGQIIWIGRMLKGKEWLSLSIPKGQSKAFNEQKLSKGTHLGHFTDDFIR